MALPTNSDHLSDQSRAEKIEEFAGKVDSQFAKTSMMRNFLTVDMITGTDTKIVRRMGKTSLKAIVPGVRPDADPTDFGRVAVTVDTQIIARANRSQLDEFQIDFNARMELGKDQGKEIGMFFDEAALIAGVKTARMSAPAGLGGAFGDGKVESLATAGDELDPDKLYKKMSTLVTRMQEEDIDTDEMAFFVRPTQFEVLGNHTKLIDRDFSRNNGDFADGTLKTVRGVPVVSTARLLNAAKTNHPLSNANNSNFYDYSAADAKATALLLHPHSLLAGETIPLTSDVFFSKEEKQWFIDSYLAFAMSGRRPDVCGVVDKA